MEMSYKFRIYPTKAQEELIRNTFGCCRFVYNYFLYEKTQQYKETKTSMTRFQQDSKLNAMKKEKKWLAEVDSRALKYSLRDLERAFSYFYKSIREEDKPTAPQYKKKRSLQAYTTSSGSVSVSACAVKLPKLGLVRCAISKEVKGRILNATVRDKLSRPVVATIVETGEEETWESAEAATKALGGYSTANISEALRGKRKTAFKRTWRYL